MTRILIATPVDGRPETATVTWGYHQKVRELERRGAASISSELMFSDDLARARSRAAHHALQRDDWDWMLWWDDDVVPSDVGIVERMVSAANATGAEVIGAPYSRKRILAQFPWQPTSEMKKTGQIDVKNNCIDVEWLAFGFMLTSRSCLQEMTRKYMSEEWFSDARENGSDVNIVTALFRQVMTPDRYVDGKRVRELLSEDYSFCYRWRALGGRILMYVGEGSPLGHVGGHMFTGTREEIGRI